MGLVVARGPEVVWFMKWCGEYMEGWDQMDVFAVLVVSSMAIVLSFLEG
jgi:hypothetical protein